MELSGKVDLEEERVVLIDPTGIGVVPFNLNISFGDVGDIPSNHL